MTSVTIPNSITSIGNDAFYGCNSLTVIDNNIEHPSNVTLGSNVFYRVNFNDCILHVANGSVAEYKEAVQWKQFVNILGFDEEITNPIVNGLEYSIRDDGTGVTVIGLDDRFTGSDLVIPASITVVGRVYEVTAIGDDAFANCT